jgi:ribonuclease VapC
MFVDASAVVAILNHEPERGALLGRLESNASGLCYSPLSRFEAIVSLARIKAGPNRSATPAEIEMAKGGVDLFLAQLDATCIDLTEPIGTGALIAAQTYGRAVGHQAALNLGDCFAYACAKERRVGLLYKGDDFARTDLG